MHSRISKFTGALVVTGALVLGPAAVAQDIAEGTVLAFDRKARVLVFKDKSVWPLELAVSDLPDGLKAGDRVEIRYDSNEDDGITVIHSVKIVAK